MSTFNIPAMSTFILFLLPLLFTLEVEAFWRMPCESGGLARLDPIVSPGAVGEHAHSVHGSGDFSMSSTSQSLAGSNCSSCAVPADRSAYWTPALYFQGSDGKTTIVPQVGGMLAYYLLEGDNIKAFPTGFQMIAGDTRQRNFTWPVPDPPTSSWTGDQVSQPALRQKALGFNCLNYAKTPEGALMRHFMPNQSFLDANCAQGVRLELMFPSCWNGKDLDSPDHKSHVAYPDLVKTGTCPDGFGTRLPSLMYETIWNTYAFKGQAGQFVFANGDTTGFGYHGDFMTGWDPNVLQQAVDTCTNLSGNIQDCPVFAPSIQTQDQQLACKISIPPQLQGEDYQGPRSGLPGGVVIQPGPAYASKAPSPSSTSTSYTLPSTAPSSAAAATPPPGTPPIGGIFAEMPSPSINAQALPTTTTPPPAPAPTTTTPTPSFATTLFSKAASGSGTLEIFVVVTEVTVTEPVTATTTLLTGDATVTAKAREAREVPATVGKRKKRHLGLHKHKHHAFAVKG